MIDDIAALEAAYEAARAAVRAARETEEAAEVALAAARKVAAMADLDARGIKLGETAVRAFHGNSWGGKEQRHAMFGTYVVEAVAGTAHRAFYTCRKLTAGGKPSRAHGSVEYRVWAVEVAQ